ncbi:MAG: SDR family NAD(P)-dependent oxidoreductase [Chthoniobacterales bacterium]
MNTKNIDGEALGGGIAVVTGASSGLGKVYADRLAKRGYDLLLVARRKDRLHILAQDLQKQYGIQANILVADLGLAVDLNRVANAIAGDDRVTVLVNNAGTASFVPSVAMSLPDLDTQLNVNARAVSHLSLAVLPEFLRKNAGTIINIGSVLSFSAVPVSASHSATKAHVMLFTIGLQQELTETKVRVQLVLPGNTATEIWDVAEIDSDAIDQATVMTAEDCVDAALAGLDQGEAVTLPSVEDSTLWSEFDVIRNKMLEASKSSQPASRYVSSAKEQALVT